MNNYKNGQWLTQLALSDAYFSSQEYKALSYITLSFCLLSITLKEGFLYFMVYIQKDQDLELSKYE